MNGELQSQHTSVLKGNSLNNINNCHTKCNDTGDVDHKYLNFVKFFFIFNVRLMVDTFKILQMSC